MTGLPMNTAFAPKASALKMCIPDRTPLSKYTSTWMEWNWIDRMNKLDKYIHPKVYIGKYVLYLALWSSNHFLQAVNLKLVFRWLSYFCVFLSYNWNISLTCYTKKIEYIFNIRLEACDQAVCLHGWTQSLRQHPIQLPDVYFWLKLSEL